MRNGLGNSDYGRHEAMQWAENDGADYIFGPSGNAALDTIVADGADNLRFHHALGSDGKLRCFENFKYQTKSWSRPHHIVDRLEASLSRD